MTVPNAEKPCIENYLLIESLIYSQERIVSTELTIALIAGQRWSVNKMNDDTISRQAAIAYAISGMTREFDGEKWIRVSEVRESLQTMPSAERHGKWIMHLNDLFPAESTMECDQCHEEQPLACDDNYCPNCGATMIDDCTTCPNAQNTNLEDDDSPCRDCEVE